tara:strand:- start:3541 stop:4491 length:951 start_codon:yes stop_codon:yes gene_type:complete
MTILKPSILILGASSFLTKPLIKELEIKNKFNIICQSRNNLKKLFTSNKSNISFLKINYINKEYDRKFFINCSYIINFVNASALTEEELSNFRVFLKDILEISRANFIHISTASVYGNCKNKVISEFTKCSPKTRYQRIKYDDEKFLQKISDGLKIKYFILRPTEIVGDSSLNARKFIKSYRQSSFIKRYFIKSFYGKRISHFVSSKYLIKNILKIIEKKVKPGIYLVSQDENKLNNFYSMCKILDLKIYKTTQKEKNYFFVLPLEWLFNIIYSIFRSNQVPPYSIFISKKPLIDPKKYIYFERDLLDHINSILRS